MPEPFPAPRIPCVPVADIELPAELAALHDLAYNLWWAWNPQATDLFHRIDGPSWERYRNPVQLLINVERHSWEPLLASDTFRQAYESVMADFRAYRDGAGASWYATAHPEPAAAGPIAYFSMEFGLHSSLAIYSGGLGILSGDHLKSASDLGLPFVAVGLLYHNGYFHQTIDPEGLQQHFYPRHDFSRLGLRPAAGPTGRELRVTLPLLDRELGLRVWVAEVGRVPLLLLDTDVPENDPGDRAITNTLYVRGREMRLIQEIVLGIGGVRTLRALGIEPRAWHINEGHCALLQLERLREQTAAGATFDEALARCAADSLFTTHTPVPAGNEVFERGLAGLYLADWPERLGIAAERLFSLADAERRESGVNLTALGLKTTGQANAVSRLNARVTGEMWGHLSLPRAQPDDGAGAGAESGQIVPVTNGVHVPTWIGDDIRRLFVRHLGTGWRRARLEPEAWEALLAVPDEEVWSARNAQKRRLTRFARSRWRRQFARHGRSPGELEEVGRLLDPEALVIGFARRFATYKRARLVFRDLDRLVALLGAAERPVQMVFAGKAHPADRPGQQLIQQIFELSQSDRLRGRVFFIEDYDMRVGFMLVQGVDVWLNTPRRPLEASGTSGQKAAMNGALNVSILDGWWPEAFDGGNGWAIAPGADDTGMSEEEQDRRDADALYRLLEDEVVPSFYRRDDSGLPRDWLARVKRSIATVTPRFSSDRMVRDYVENHYLRVS